MKSPIVSGNRTAWDIADAYYKKKAEECAAQKKEPQGERKQDSPSVIAVSGDFLKLENIVCVGADGNIFEQYPELHIRKDIFYTNSFDKDFKRVHQRFTPYQAIVHCEQQDLFNPSIALHCAILAKCFQEKGKNAQAKAMLDQYRDYGTGYGWHTTNTLIDWGNEKIIHYPQDSDFPSQGRNKNINKGMQKKVLPFSRKDLSNMLLKDALKLKPFMKFIQNLTGLQDPSVLVKMGEYFQKEAYFWVSTSNEARAAWLGCSNGSFGLSASGSLDYLNAARGVRARP